MMAFTPRACPLCGSTKGAIILSPEAAEFCRANWSYDPRWRELLGLPPRAQFPLRRCSSCALVYATLLPDDDFMRTLYDQVIVPELCVEGSEHSQSYSNRLRYVADLLQLTTTKRKARALDFGSGAGVTLRIFEASNIDAVGFEPSESRADYSRKAGSQMVSRLQALTDEAPFTIVVLDNVLEHIPCPVETLHLIGSITAPDAVAFVSVPNFEDAVLRREIERHRRGEELTMAINPWEHLNYFSRMTLDRLMAQGGFQPITGAELPHPPDIGLRPEHSSINRINNSLASTARLLRWMATGESHGIVERRFYRRQA
jgi:SAM-dependent methyltransferase